MSFRRLCFNVGILLDMFLLPVHAMIQKSERAQKGSNCLTLIRKSEVSLGNASRALVSHLGPEKWPWHLHRRSCQFGNLFVTVGTQWPLFQYHSLIFITAN